MAKKKDDPRLKATADPAHTHDARQHDIHPVLAEVLAEETPDTISWVKG